MCMITVVPAGITPPMTGIKNGGLANNDGHGWAVGRGDTLLIGKSMSLEEAMDGYNDALLELGRGSVSLFHSRYATHGTKSIYNVHPFYVAGRDDTVLAHNGVLPYKYRADWKDKEDLRSDTHWYADMCGALIENARGIPSLGTAGRIADDIGKTNKLVFLSVKSGKARMRLINRSMGVDADGVWYSNHAWEMPPQFPGRGSLANCARPTTTSYPQGTRGSTPATVGARPTGTPTTTPVGRPVSHFPSAAQRSADRTLWFADPLQAEARGIKMPTDVTVATRNARIKAAEASSAAATKAATERVAANAVAQADKALLGAPAGASVVPPRTGLVQPAQRQPITVAMTPQERLKVLRKRWGWDDEDGNPTDKDPDTRSARLAEEARLRLAAREAWSEQQAALTTSARTPGPVGSEVVRWSDRTERTTLMPEVSSTDPDACVTCRNVVDDLGYCTVCGVCQDCLADDDNCYCFSAARQRAKEHLPEGTSWEENVMPLFSHAESTAWAD